MTIQGPAGAVSKRAGKRVEIISRYTSKCSECGMPVGKGEECIWDGETRQVQHIEGLCATEFQVHCVYRTTRKVLKIVEFNADRALDKAERDCSKRRKVGATHEAMKGHGKATPDQYICYREGVEVGRRIAA